ncbi:hypothetical protein L208DRAFT_1473398, partial [Tricholoma matsutake]
MKRSRMRYSFVEHYSPNILDHKALPLLLMIFRDRGRAASDSEIKLRCIPMDPTLTLQKMFEARNRYTLAAAGNGIEDAHFVIHLIVCEHPLTAITSFDTDLPRVHNCISKRVYHQFPGDLYPSNQDAETDTSCAESQSEPDSDMEDILPTTSLWDIVNVSAHHPMLWSSATLMQDTQTPSTLVQTASIPEVLWVHQWAVPVFLKSKTIPLADMKSTAFREATVGSDVEKLEIRGSDVRALAQAFLNTLGEAVKRGDFTSVLLPQREFDIVIGRDRIQSFGEGVEREALQIAFQEYQDNSTMWFLQRQDHHSSLVTLGLQRRQPSSSQCSIKLSVLGALTALLLLYGIPPNPLSPVLLHYFIHDLDLNSISCNLLGNWYPDLGRLIQDWIDARPDGNIESFSGHFLTYHDTPISLLTFRDEAIHHSLACEMLYQAIVGPAPPDHPDIQSFLHGFYLPCHNGFHFPNFIKHIEGGTEILISMLWASNVTSPSDLLPYLQIRTLSSDVVHQLAAAVPDSSMTFSSIVQQFLHKTGVPCPTLFEDAKPHFTANLVNLSDIGPVSFCSKILAWAATGSVSINTNDAGISIMLISNYDYLYCLGERDRPTMLENGKICFRTCLKEARLPLSWLVKLACHRYSGDVEPSSFHAAVHHWLLCECINAIGSHSIL